MCVFDSKKIGWKKYMCVIMVDGIFEKHLWLEIKIYNYLLMKKKQIGNTYIYIITMMNKVFFFCGCCSRHRFDFVTYFCCVVWSSFKCVVSQRAEQCCELTVG